MISLLNAYSSNKNKKEENITSNSSKGGILKNSQTNQSIFNKNNTVSTSSNSRMNEVLKKNTSTVPQVCKVHVAQDISTDEKESSSFSSTQPDEKSMEIEPAKIPEQNNNNTLNIRLENLKKARENQKKNLELKKLNKTSSVLPKKSPVNNNNILNSKSSVQNTENKKTPNEHVEEEQNTPNDKKYKRKSKMEKYKLWNKDCYFISIDPPVKLPDESKTRYKICFKYFSSPDNKVKRKTVCFGKKNIEYLVDHCDDDRNKMWLSKQRGYYTPFHKNFWINYLLCSEISINKAYNKALEILLQ